MTSPGFRSFIPSHFHNGSFAHSLGMPLVAVSISGMRKVRHQSYPSCRCSLKWYSRYFIKNTWQLEDKKHPTACNSEAAGNECCKESHIPWIVQDAFLKFSEILPTLPTPFEVWRCKSGCCEVYVRVYVGSKGVGYGLNSGFCTIFASIFCTLCAWLRSNLFAKALIPECLRVGALFFITRDKIIYHWW